MIKVESVLPAARGRLATLGTASRLVEAAGLLSGPERNLIVVNDDQGRMAGVVTKTDVVGRISRCTGSSCTVPVEQVMNRDVVACRPSDWLEDVWRLFSERRLKNIPVVDADDAPLGVLNVRDALEALLEDVQHEEQLLRDYVMGVGYR